MGERAWGRAQGFLRDLRVLEGGSREGVSAVLIMVFASSLGDLHHLSHSWTKLPRALCLLPFSFSNCIGRCLKQDSRILGPDRSSNAQVMRHLLLSRFCSSTLC